MAKLHGRESGSFDMGVRRVAWTRVWSCGNFLSARLRKFNLILEGNVPERLFRDPELRREGKTRGSSVGSLCEKEIEAQTFSLHTKLAVSLHGLYNSPTA